MTDSLCLVSVGSNLEPETNIRRALVELEHRFGALRCSDVFETPAEGFEGPAFLNLAVAFDTALSATRIREELRIIEDICGRRREGAKFSSRTMDLDLLLLGDSCIETPDARVPHPDLCKYAFVACPVAQLAPSQVHPSDGRTLARIWRDMQRTLKTQLRRVDFPVGVTPRIHPTSSDGRP